MKSSDLFDAIGNADDSLIANAKSPIQKKKSYKKPLWISAIAAMLTLAVLFGTFLLPNDPTGLPSYALVKAEYLPNTPYPGDSSSPDFSKRFNEWKKAQEKNDADFYALDINIDSFLSQTIGEFLSLADGENAVYSPLNVYMAFAMLAELTDNQSRQQILDVLGVDSIETLRKEATALWEANYSNDGLTTSVLASAVFLSDRYTYEKETMQTLADIYYASSFSGKMGTEEYNRVLRDWLNEQTGNLLSDSAEAIEMEPETVMALATTVYFKARWGFEFEKENTENGIFHSPDGDVSCEYMKESGKMLFYQGEHFTALKKELGRGDKNAMWFILPNDGVTTDDLLKDSEALAFLSSPKISDEAIVHFSLPKFDISSDIDLREGMKNLGITDVFNSELSDFTPMTKDRNDIFVSAADHSTRVSIDEEGCTATAFTVVIMTAEGGTENEITLTLDRPFLFSITSDVGLPLFVGTVNTPN